MFRLVRQDGVARTNLNLIVAVTRIDPDRLLHRGADDDPIIPAQRIHDDGEEITFWWEQLAQSAGCQRPVAVLAADEIEEHILRIPNAIAARVDRVEIETDLRGEREAAVVLGKAGDEMMVL